MAYDEKFRERAVAYKDNGHTRQLKEAFGISSRTYYNWKKNKEIAGLFVLKVEQRTRKRKINPEELIAAVKEKPDIYLWELAEKFNSVNAIHKRLKQLKITKKTFTYSEKSDEDRAEYLKKLEKVPKEKRVYVDETIHKHLGNTAELFEV